MKVDVIGKLSEGAYQNWRYLYYSQRPNIYFEEIINFYTYNNSKNGFGIIKYNYLGQQNVITKSFWNHWNLNVVNCLQPHIDIITNMMLTTTNLNVITDIDPNFIELSKVGFSVNKIQYNTNYFIFLDQNEIIEQFNLYNHNRKHIEKYLIKEKINISNNFDKVLQNYKK